MIWKPIDINRQRRMLEYRPLNAVREQRAMEYHEQVQRDWEATGCRLAKMTGRDPSALAMFGDDNFRRIAEERFLIDQVLNVLPKKAEGIWDIAPRIGDLYAQRDKVTLSRFETIRNPGLSPDAGALRSSSFFASKYYRKRVRQLRGAIEKIRPYNSNCEGLIVIGHAINIDNLQSRAEVTEEEAAAEDSQSVPELVQESVVRVSIKPRRLFFTTAPGATQSRFVHVANEGTTAVYYAWEIARDVELALGEGANRTSAKRGRLGNEDQEPFDWAASDAFNLARNVQPKTRSEFCFTQKTGSIRPGCSVTFSFVFKSDVPGCFTQRWIMRVTPAIKSARILSVSLRGCCEIGPPNLSTFKLSIDENLHESERNRCVEEILGSIFDRVAQVVATHRQSGEERIDGDVLVDDRAPSFEEANRQWNLTYSPGLYGSLMAIANRCWDALGVTGFGRFWDLRVTSLTEMAMRVRDGAAKRALLKEINAVLRVNMTASALGNLTFSLAYVQLSTMLEDLPDRFLVEARILGTELPLFLVPKMPDPGELDDAESGRRKHRNRKDRKPPPKKPPPKKGARPIEEEPSRGVTPNPEAAEINPELKAAIRLTIRDQLRTKLLAFENLANESRAVGQQLTRVNEIERLETNLDAEVDDEL
jgi:hypothetical protein